MNDKLDEQVFELRDEIVNSDIAKEYFRLKREMDNNADLIDISKNLRHHQRRMVESIGNDDIYQKERKEYLFYLEKYNSFPLIINYEEVKEELSSLIEEVSRIISKS